MIIIETTTRERLVLVPEKQIVCTTHTRDATPADLERAGFVPAEEMPEALRRQRDDWQRKAESLLARAEQAVRERDEARACLDLDDGLAEGGSGLGELLDAARQAERERERAVEWVERADQRETAARNALTAAGVPDAEPYPAEAVDAHEASLRTGGRSLHTPERIARLAAERDEAREAMASVVGQLRGRDEETQRLAGTLRERNEAKELARVLEVERDTLHAELADAKAERDRAIRDCAATAAERNEARAEVARLAAPAEGEPSFEHLRDCWDMAPRADASGSDVFRNGFFALYRLGVAHERARLAAAGVTVATAEELERAYSAAYARAWESEVSTPDRGERAGLRAVAARVRQERCLIAQAVAANVDVRVCEDNDGGFMVGVHATGCDEELARCVPASDVPATLARLLGEVSR